MRIEKKGFLLSYVVYLLFCIVFSIVSGDESAINTMIFAITIASAAFSISDLFFTMLDIDDKELELLIRLYALYNFASEFYEEKIVEKWGDKAERIESLLTDLLGENDVAKFFDGNLSSIEKQNVINKIKCCEDSELIEFVERFFASDTSKIRDIDEAEKDTAIQEIFQRNKKNIKRNRCLATGVAIIGLITLLIVLTIRINILACVSNILTIIAFLSVIINLLVKDYYKKNSIESYESDRREILEELESTVYKGAYIREL